MCSVFVSIFLIVLALSVESKEKASGRGKVKNILESMETNCDHDVVEYFHKTKDNTSYYTFRVVKAVKAFSVNIVMRALKSQRIMYKLDNLDGCQFISNQILNKVFAQIYDKIVVNNSFKGCPILPNVYYLRNMNSARFVPTFHPAGRYQSTVRILMTGNPGPYVMEIIAKYDVQK